MFVVNNYPPQHGGVENHVANLAEGLVALGHQCTVTAVGANYTDQVQNGVRVIRYPGRFSIGSILTFPRFGTSRRIRKLIKDQHVEIISVHTRFFPMSWLGINVANKTQRSSIITEHGSNYVAGVSPLIAIASRIVDHTLGRRALRMATVRLAISESSQSFIRRLSGMNSVVFYNAIQTSKWKPHSERAQNRLVFVGRLVPGKGWEDAVRVFEHLAPGNPDLELDIYGNGADFAATERAVHDSAHADRIHLHGAQPGEIIRDSLAGGVLLNPTALSEGFQTTLLEAMAAGSRIVSYPTPGLEHLISSGAQIWRASNTAELIEMTSQALREPPKFLTPTQLKQWDWRTRAEEYAALASDTATALS